MKPRIAILQHAASEGPGAVADWLEARGFILDYVRWWENPDTIPPPSDFFGAVILGGAMNIYQHRDHPWLVPEKKWLDEALQHGVRCLGICLGAQLLADRLGAKVVQNPLEEIGWWPVDFTTEARAHFPALPLFRSVLHWHGDTFSLPKESVRLAASQACPEQGFYLPGRVLAWQFHPEVTLEMLPEFCGPADATWPVGPFVQDRPTVLSQATTQAPGAFQILENFLPRFFDPE
jgi:GMP synthase-like glutamine amidotransferase